MDQFLIKGIILIKGMILSPIIELNKVKKGLIHKNIIYLIFLITMLITLAKTPSRIWLRVGDNLPSIKYVNEIVNLLYNPFIMWMVAYLSYFCSIFIIVNLCNYFKEQEKCENLPCLIMSVSSLGIAAQILFLPLNYILSKNILIVLGLFFRFWNLILISLAIKISASLSNINMVLIVIITIVVVTILSFGIGTFMDPYLFYLF